MTNKEAIDNLKNYIECLMGDYGYYKDIVEFRDSVEHLEKSLQTQKAEIEKYKYLYQKALDNTIKSDRELFDKKAEIEKKDKMIEYMANFINDNTPYTKDTRILENERGVRNTKYTEKYFERKIK